MNMKEAEECRKMVQQASIKKKLAARWLWLDGYKKTI